MKKTVLVGYYENEGVVAEIDGQVKLKGGQRSDFLRQAIRHELWGPLASLVELKRDLQEELARIQDTIQKNSEAILASEKEASS